MVGQRAFALDVSSQATGPVGLDADFKALGEVLSAMSVHAVANLETLGFSATSALQWLAVIAAMYAV